MEYYEYDSTGQKRRFSFSYQILKEEYDRIKQLSNEEFLNEINSILHTTIFICRIKEIPTSCCLSDCGIIHELVHLLNNIEICHSSLADIRNMWNNICELS